MSSGSDSLGAPGPSAAPGDAPHDPAAYWSERLAQGGDLESVGWRGLGESYNRWLYRRRAAVFRAVARHYGWQRRPPAVLELGPGTGFYADLWARLGVRELTGIDIAPPAVARLRRRFSRYQFLSGDIGRPMALPPHAFNVVTAFDVLFHVVDDAAFEQALRSIARALRPGGLALITDLFPPTREIRLPHQVSRTAGRYQEALGRAAPVVDRRRADRRPHTRRRRPPRRSPLRRRHRPRPFRRRRPEHPALGRQKC